MAVDILNTREYLENFLQIVDKNKKLIPLRLNPSQEILYDVFKQEHEAGRPVRLVVLKGRQQGISTLTEGIFFADTATHKLAKTLIVAHIQESTEALFNMNKVFFDYLPERIKPMRKNSNAKELVFENPTRNPQEKAARPGLMSRIRCVTAGSRGVGRSETFRNVHLSEVAFWPKFLETLDGIMQAVPDSPDTCVVIESTANGWNEFKSFWDDAVEGKNGFRAVFLPWFMEPGYRKAAAPGTEWTQAERALAEQYGLDEEQLSWRRWCIAINCHGSENIFRQEYPCNPDEAFLLSGSPFFDAEKIMALRASAPPPESVGYFVFDTEPDGRPTNIRWQEDAGMGFIRIWAKPRERAPYVLGADTAGDGSDRFTAIVLDNTTGEQAAELQRELSEIVYTRQLYCLGQYYNGALMAVEVNFSSYPQLMLEQWQYPSFYTRQRLDSYTHEFTKAWGFRTDAQSRQLILAGLHRVMEETPALIKSFWLLGEMLVFQYNKDLRPEAAPGEHDDLVMAAAIAYFARSQQRVADLTPPTEPKKKLIDQLQAKQKGRRRPR